LQQLGCFGWQNRIRILIRRAAHADVGQRCKLHANLRSHALPFADRRRQKRGRLRSYRFFAIFLF
jgi:hypothetical protein